MKLGIDFGSTYTTISRYRTDYHGLEAYDSGDGVAIPSVVSINKSNKTTCGFVAKSRIGKEGFRTFKTFKMLMREKDKSLVEYRQYDKTYTPQWAVKTYLSSMVAEAQRVFSGKIEKIIVGAPDVWFHDHEMLSGRAVLCDSCSHIDGVKEVMVVSEPVLASAYFAHNFQQSTGEPFNGAILIIDYGGATLDLSLVEIKKVENSGYEIKMLESSGTCEHADNCVGNAGIVYMETLMADVIRKHEEPQVAGEIIGTNDFYAAVNEVEKQLKQGHKAGDIEDVFDGIGIDDLDMLESYELEESIICGTHKYRITYADLVRTYDKTIRKVFDEKMDEMIQRARQKHDIDVYSTEGEDFKIALIGGFGNYYLVRQQMHDKFRLSYLDDREKEIIYNEKDRECAVSYGAALVADGVIKLENAKTIGEIICI